MADLTAGTIEEIADLTRLTVQAQTLPQEGAIPFVVLPEGVEVHDLRHLIDNDLAPRPRRAKGIVKVFDALSFVRYFADFRDETSRIFADETSGSVTAILDYHQASDFPQWCQHRISLVLRHSEEWKAWTAQNGKQVNQTAFAEFIESNAPDIFNPPAATMLDLARSINATSDIACESAIRTNNGTVQFRYNEVVKGTYGAAGEFSIPEQFTVRIPVYLGSPVVELTARLRYRVASSKITLWYDLLRAGAVERDAFRVVRNSIENDAECPIINGAPA